MQLALYHPHGGYYMREHATTGNAGDFSTSVDVSPAFGQRLAVQAAEVVERLDQSSWQLVELGPGRGLLTVDLLDGLRKHSPDLLRRLDCLTMVEISPTLAASQRALIRKKYPDLCLRQTTSLDQLAEQSVSGLILANEFFDALPVHSLIRNDQNQLREQHVTVDRRGALCWTHRPIADPRLEQLANEFELCRHVGDRAEICLALTPVARDLARVLRSGALLFIDYGHDAQTLADARHADGTLVGYAGHQVVSDILQRPGHCDITAHVNWTHLEQELSAAGLTVAGRTTQDRFLLALGLIEEMTSGSTEPFEVEALQQRLAARSLILPSGGGKRFQVLLAVKAIEPDLRGLGPPVA